MRIPLLAAAIAAVVLTPPARAQMGTLRVVRATPTADAGPMQQISVAFDRPVAGSLDRSVDPATIFHIEPAVRGRLEWRDPVTIRLPPAAPLTSGTRYTITVSNNFRAMDGSALAEPYQFTFRVHGPLLLAGTPVSAGGGDHVEPNQRFALVYSSPIDLPTLTGTAYIEMSATCGGDRAIRLDAVSQRPIESGDRGDIREAGGYERDHSTDSLRRVVQLAPRAPLPRGCRAELIAPSELSAEGSRGTARWAFSTYGDLHIESLKCNEAYSQSCPNGPLTIVFSNPIKGSEVAKRLRLIPQTPFRVRDTVSALTYWTLDAKLKPRVSYAVVADTALRDIYGQPLRGNPAAGYTTTGFTPTIVHPIGHELVERVGGYRTLAVEHVNVDTLVATIAPVPDSLVPKILNRYGWRNDSLWTQLQRGATVQRLPVRAGMRDQPLITGIPLPTIDAARPHTSPLLAVRIEGNGASGEAETSSSSGTIVQVTDLGVHAKIGSTEGAVWVTGVSDGKPRSGAPGAPPHPL